MASASSGHSIHRRGQGRDDDDGDDGGGYDDGNGGYTSNGSRRGGGWSGTTKTMVWVGVFTMTVLMVYAWMVHTMTSRDERHALEIQPALTALEKSLNHLENEVKSLSEQLDKNKEELEKTRKEHEAVKSQMEEKGEEEGWLLFW